MQQKDNILARLASHEAPPPPEVSSDIMAAYDRIVQEEGNGQEILSLQNLSHKITDPPANVTAGVMGSFIDHHAKKSFIQNNKWRLIAAAAMLAFAVFLYNFLQPKVLDNQLATEQDKPAIKSNDSALLETIKTGAGDSSTKTAIIPGPQNNNQRFSINGQYGALLNNDLWYSFLDEKATGTIIISPLSGKMNTHLRIDEYTQLSINSTWATAINESREKKKNGKLTFKARRTKKKLDKLKQREENFFGVPKKNNPLNPIQLSNFLEQ